MALNDLVADGATLRSRLTSGLHEVPLDWLMSPEGQAIGAKANSLQSPANRMFKPDPRIPSMDNVRLIKYDFEKYGSAAERKRLLERWQKEVEALPR